MVEISLYFSSASIQPSFQIQGGFSKILPLLSTNEIEMEVVLLKSEVVLLKEKVANLILEN